MAAPDPSNTGWNEEWWKQSRPEAVPIRVPGVIQEKFPGYHGVVWYWTEIDVPLHTSFEGRFLLRFTAVNYKADVWVGDWYVGGHEGGEMPFDLDVTSAIRSGAGNRLAVRVVDPGWEIPIDGFTKQQTPRRGGLAFQHGGIEGSVELVLAPVARIADLHVRPDPLTGKVSVFLKLLNSSDRPREGTVRIGIARDGDGETIDRKVLNAHLKPGEVELESELIVTSPVRWDVDSPHLYRVTAEITTGTSAEARDVCTVPLGFRDFRFEDGAFRLNGRRIFLRCVQHSQFDALRFWLPYDLGEQPDYFQRRLIAAKEMGFNCIRLF